MKRSLIRYCKLIWIGWLIVAFSNACHPHSQAPGTFPTDSSGNAPGSLKEKAMPAWALLPFTKADKFNPILRPDSGCFTDPIRNEKTYWEEKDVFNPAVVVREGRMFMLYRAEDRKGRPDGTSRIGLAESADGLHFTRYPSPVLYPDKDPEKKYEWEGGCEDPRIVEDDQGTYYMTYTAFDGQTARLMVATSRDLLHWIKRGPAFAKAYRGKYRNAWSKSGSIVSEYKEGRIVAARLNGKYWMYWGDLFIWAAVSEDLVNWTPVEKASGEGDPVPLKGRALDMPALRIVLPTRLKKFDSDLVESGPPALLTSQGILLVYNSRNIPAIGDSTLPEGTYAAGQVLLDRRDPTHILQRLDRYFMRPDRLYEQTGQVNQVCFVEGLALFRNKWFLYYGTADSRIAVATCPAAPPR
jgi:predicted GH43/DUF377 family glycosyl hydrolase